MKIEQTRKSGLFIPTEHENHQNEGIVMAISQELDDSAKNQISVGDKVVFSRYSGVELMANEEKVFLIEAKSVLAIVRES